MTFGPRTFVVRLADDAMAPAFERGDFVYVDPDVPMAPGDFVAVIQDSTTTVRQLKDMDRQPVLWTLNPERPDCVVHAGNETLIRGVVVFYGNTV